LFVALLFASFAVAQSVQAEPDENSPNVAESAAMTTAVNQPNQRMIVFDYTTDPITCCCFSEQVELHGNILISFKKIGTRVRPTASLVNFEGVGLTTKRDYVADTVTLGIINLSNVSPGFRLLLPTAPWHIAVVNIQVTGKHPTDLNSATGDPLPGQDVHFQLQYVITWKSLNGRVTRFIPDSLNGDGKGNIGCN
jgi:hypothetical protein